MAVFSVKEPYDSLVEILWRLQVKAAHRDFTGTIDTANEIVELFNTYNKAKEKL